MSVLKNCLGVFSILFSLMVAGTQICLSESPKTPTPRVPTTWWPDPSTGIMWTGESSYTVRGVMVQGQMTWNEAGNYCSSLALGGFSGWRLPTIDEMRHTEYFYPVTVTDKDMQDMETTYYYLAMKGGISAHARIWTSTPAADNQQYMSVAMGAPDTHKILLKPKLWRTVLYPELANTHELESKVSDRHAVLCVRPIDADLLQLTKDAMVSYPVPDLLTLKANVPMNKARQAYNAQDYQTAIAQSQNALTIKQDLAPAYWGIGISYGMLGQWDQAITNIQSALKIDKKYKDAEIALEWAKDGQKAAKKNKQSKESSPKWN